MNSQILFLESQQRSAEIARRAEARQRRRGAGSSRKAAEVVIRLAAEPDRAAIERLSQLEGRRTDGPLLLAEVSGEVQAAIALRSGAVVADPFRRTAELVELLERCRGHRNGASRERGSALGRFGAAVRELLRPPRRPGSRAPTALGNETTLIR